MPIDTSSGRSSASALATDRLYVDLMRSQLFVKVAEQKARRLEVQLKEMKSRYERKREAEK
jgi:hypothetical protein